MDRVFRFMRRIGACSKCMHESFLAAAAAWALCLVAWLGGLAFATTVPLTVAAIVAAGLTLLWLVHLTVFAIRSVAPARGPDARDSVAPIASGSGLARRAVLVRFASAFVAAALITGLGRRPAFAAQWYECGGVYCGGNACCPVSHPILNHCDCRCYRQSNDFNNCGSYNQCALDGSNCS
jgi:hypothetical protein